MDVSLFASAIRKNFYEDFLKSLKETTCSYEVVFAGNVPPDAELMSKYPEFKYITTGNIKPAQCYEVARRACAGELIQWTADDCIYSGNIIGKAYDYWKAQGNQKLILSLQTKENGVLLDMRDHRFFGFDVKTPLMAPLGLMSRVWLQELGGVDRRYLCGQYENDIVVRAIKDGGVVEIFKGGLITIDHFARHGVERSFATGYPHDREILEKSWCHNGTVDSANLSPNSPFEPFEDKDILTRTQEPKGQWK